MWTFKYLAKPQLFHHCGIISIPLRQSIDHTLQNDLDPKFNPILRSCQPSGCLHAGDLLALQKDNQVERIRSR